MRDYSLLSLFLGFSVGLLAPTSGRAEQSVAKARGTITCEPKKRLSREALIKLALEAR